VIAGLSGGGGKTLISTAIALAARRRELDVRAFKKGPDYIDAAWLTWASGRPARNLDSWLMGFDGAVDSFRRTAAPHGLNVIEGNRGLYDGVDAHGTHSTAALAKALGTPVILTVDATKATRTLAACVLGCRTLDPDVKIAGVILNRVGGARHERVICQAMEGDCGIPVVGAVPKLGENLLPERHLGLVTPAERGGGEELEERLAAVAQCLDWERLITAANRTARLNALPRAEHTPKTVKIGYLKDSVFTFYYPENLEALEQAGAELVPIDSLHATQLPEVDALYIGGGFPETHAAALAANHGLLRSIRDRAAGGLPVYAECGGLMLLSHAIRAGDETYPMADVLPVEVEMCAHPQGHGYGEIAVDRENPFFPVGLKIRGHRFHYSRVLGTLEMPPNVWASYTHLHALGTPEWVDGMMAAARQYDISIRTRLCIAGGCAGGFDR
jgi:cobyrinic acid a,c-diamide synthase